MSEENLKEEFENIGKRLYEKFGGDSYIERCNLFDLKEKCINQQKEIKRLQAIENEFIKVWEEDGDNGAIQRVTPIAWYRVLRLTKIRQAQ